MATIFHNIPRDAETVAAVRRGCTEHGLAKGCRERACRRARRCRAAWRACEMNHARVLPPCLLLRTDALYARLGEAEAQLVGLRLIVARARKLPDARYAAELPTFPADDATPP